jgi:hypothetical protein
VFLDLIGKLAGHPIISRQVAMVVGLGPAAPAPRPACAVARRSPAGQFWPQHLFLREPISKKQLTYKLSCDYNFTPNPRYSKVL